MKMDSSHDYALLILDPDQCEVGQRSVVPDWDPIRSGLEFDALRADVKGPLHAPQDWRVRIEPVWDESNRGPVCHKLRATLVPLAGETAEAAAVSEFAAVPYFRSHVQQEAAQYVERGKLKAGASIHYQVLA